MAQKRVREWKGEDAYYFYRYYKESGSDLSTFFTKDTTKMVRIKAIAVQGGGSAYQWLDVNVGDKDDVYNRLIHAAKVELLSQGLPININLDTSKDRAGAESYIEKSLLDFMETSLSMLGKDFSFESLKKIKKNRPKKITPQFKNYVFAALFGSDALKNYPQLVTVKDSKTFANLLNALIRGGSGITELGFVNEVALASVGQYMIAKQIGNILGSMQYGTQAKEARISDKEKIFAESKKPYIPTNTIDLKIDLQESMTEEKPGSFNLSLKMAKDFYRVKYKEFSGSQGDPFTEIARWTNLTRTYIAWASFQKPSLLYARGGNFAYYVAATFASLALGGFKENRALFLMKSNEKQISIKSLDVALKELKDITAFRFLGFKVVNEDAYIENVQKLGSVVHDDMDEIYTKYSTLKQVNFNYSLRTLGPYKNLGV